MRVLLVGGNGQVGHELHRALARAGELIVTTRDGRLHGGEARACDLSHTGAVADLIEAVKPDVVINATAYTAVDKAETETETARQINEEAVREMAAACAAQGIALVHYSTDYVFDGQATAPYKPDAATAPLGVYGATKLAGEDAIRGSGARHLILRTAWVYGLYGHNFLKTMLRLGGERDVLNVVHDQIGSPTPAWLIADITAEILKNGIGEGGTHHLVAAGKTSWHGFAEAIFDEAVARGLIARRPTVTAIPSNQYPTPAQRPAWSVLDTRSLENQYGVKLPSWQDALKTTFDRQSVPAD